MSEQTIEGLIQKWRDTAAEGGVRVNREPATQVFNETLLSCAAELAALPSPPSSPDACINCQTTGDGGYMVCNEDEPFVGPFCSQCWDYINRYVTSPPSIERAGAQEQETPMSTPVEINPGPYLPWRLDTETGEIYDSAHACVDEEWSEFIVRAVNNHHALVEALKVAEKHVSLAYARNPQVEAFAADLTTVRAALRQAENV